MERKGIELETENGGRTNRIKLNRLKIEGYKSLRDVEVGVGDVTVLLGANGAGKSNLVSFFRMLGFLSTGALQEFIGRAGRSDSLLFGGRKATPQIRAETKFVRADCSSGHRASTTYRMRLGDAAPDTLIFLSERALYHQAAYPTPQEVVLGAGHLESRLPERAREGDRTCRVLLGLLSRCRSYQFHDTSPHANIRKSRYIEDASYLRDDAGNLAPYLYALRETRPDCYRRIVDTVRLVFPTFEDFSLAPGTTNPREIILNWREQGRSGHLFGPHQLSDGTLRFMALATLLLQPQEKLPSVIILDEPELGLHPYAISVLAAMVRSTATKAQVVLATQSPRLVDEFEPEDIVVLEAKGPEGTECRRPDPDELAEWLEEYSLGELWEKNHFGGRP
jgi:predicted ATPase